MSAAERYNIHSQLEHLQSKYVGTGHADTTRFEWVVNQHRDSIASYTGHDNLLSYFAVVENETKARVKFNLLQVYIVTSAVAEVLANVYDISPFRKCCSLVDHLRRGEKTCSLHGRYVELFEGCRNVQ
jgi:splicing factor 3B subunit 5